MLHGMPGGPLAFTINAAVESKLDDLISRRIVKPMILVFPDGRIGGQSQTDSEWANTASGRFESYVVDVVHDVDQRLATLPYRQDRVIAGLSAGAYGAINIGLHQVSLFGLIQVWSGYFPRTRTGVFAHATYELYRGGHDWRPWSPRMGQMLIMASHYFAPAPAALPSRDSL
jgi:enterochelin esterase-like enzyme